MRPVRSIPLSDLYAEDETAWLDRMSELVRHRRLAEIDLGVTRLPLLRTLFPGKELRQ